MSERLMTFFVASQLATALNQQLMYKNQPWLYDESIKLKELNSKVWSIVPQKKVSEYCNPIHVWGVCGDNGVNLIYAEQPIQDPNSKEWYVHSNYDGWSGLRVGYKTDDVFSREPKQFRLMPVENE